MNKVLKNIDMKLEKIVTNLMAINDSLQDQKYIIKSVRLYMTESIYSIGFHYTVHTKQA